MPFRPDAAKVQFSTSPAMPSLVYRACVETDVPSNTRYYQEAVCEKLSRDLGIPLAELLADLPPNRGPAAHLYDPEEHTMSRYGVPSPALASFGGGSHTIEDVR